MFFVGLTPCRHCAVADASMMRRTTIKKVLLLEGGSGVEGDGRGLLICAFLKATGMLTSAHIKTRERAMSDSVYKVIEIIGTSKDSSGKCGQDRGRAREQDTARFAGRRRVSQDLVIEEGKVAAYRTKLSVSFKYTD